MPVLEQEVAADGALQCAGRRQPFGDAAHPREPYALTLNPLPASGRIGSDITSS